MPKTKEPAAGYAARLTVSPEVYACLRVLAAKHGKSITGYLSELAREAVGAAGGPKKLLGT